MSMVAGFSVSITNGAEKFPFSSLPAASNAPLLAVILGYFTKYSSGTTNNPAAYIFRNNENLPAYLLMSVIVFLFLGLTISSEEIIIQNPEVIILADAPYGQTPEIVAARAGWNVIAAVQNGRVYPFDPFLVSVPGPRMIDGLESLAKLLHPDLFK